MKTNFKILPLRLPTQFSPNEKEILPPYRRILFCTRWLFYIPQDLRDLLEFKSFLSQNLMPEAPFPDEKAGHNCLSFYSFFSARNRNNNVPLSFNSAWICLLSSLSCFYCWQSCYAFSLSNNLHRPQLDAEVQRAQSPTSFVLSSIICNLKWLWYGFFSH